MAMKSLSEPVWCEGRKAILQSRMPEWHEGMQDRSKVDGASQDTMRHGFDLLEISHQRQRWPEKLPRPEAWKREGAGEGIELGDLRRFVFELFGWPWTKLPFVDFHVAEKEVAAQQSEWREARRALLAKKLPVWTQETLAEMLRGANPFDLRLVLDAVRVRHGNQISKRRMQAFVGALFGLDRSATLALVSKRMEMVGRCSRFFELHGRLPVSMKGGVSSLALDLKDVPEDEQVGELAKLRQEASEEQVLAAFLRDARRDIAAGYWSQRDLQELEERLPAFWLAFAKHASAHAAARQQVLVELAEEEAEAAEEEAEQERVEAQVTKAGVEAAGRRAEEYEDWFSEEFQDAMHAVAFEFRGRCAENGRLLDEALFVAVWSDARVRQALDRARLPVFALLGAALARPASGLAAFRQWRQRSQAHGQQRRPPASPAVTQEEVVTEVQEMMRQRPDLFRRSCFEVKAQVLEWQASLRDVKRKESRRFVLRLAVAAGLVKSQQELDYGEVLKLCQTCVRILELASCDSWKAVARDLLRRDLLANGLHAKDCSAGFFGEDPSAGACSRREFRDMDVAGLARVASSRVCGGLRCGLGRACEAGVCEGAPRRARAVRWLQSFFPVQAEQEARLRGHHAGCWQDFWQQSWEEAVREGVEVCNRRVCCRTSVRARVPLRSNGLPASFSAPVLPVFDGDGELWDGSEEARRRCHLVSGSVVHGSELFALPADFLCKACALVFFAKEFNVDALTKEEVDEWRQRLRLQSRCGREAVRREHARALAREELLHLARERRFDAFREKLLACVRVQSQDSLQETPCVLEEVAVLSLERAARKALEPALFSRGVCAEQREWCRRRFGVNRQTQGLYRCLPLCRGGDARDLCDWTAYTGAPGLLSERVWLCRLWARALGGVERMPTKVPQGVNDFCRLRDPEAVEALEDLKLAVNRQPGYRQGDS